MARITIPEGAGGELVQVWSLSPELGGAVGNLSAAVYGDRLVSPRVREVARMRIAQINGCNVCLQWRFPEMADRGVTEELYEHVEDPANGDYSEQELLAIEYADKFALDHRSIDDAVLRPPARRVHRRRDRRAHRDDRQLARVRSLPGRARRRRGVRLGATDRRRHPGEGGRLMARVALPGEGSDLERVWSLSPELGAAVGQLASKVGGKGLALSWRVREAARMRIAQINGCNICMAWRVPVAGEARRRRGALRSRRGSRARRLLGAGGVGDRVRRQVRARPPLARRRVLRPHEGRVHRPGDLRAHGVHRRLGRVRTHDRGARPRRGVRVVARRGRQLRVCAR